MISDFICLEEMEGSANSMIYMCSLPDPDLEHEDSMVLCGYVRLWQNPNTSDCTLNIELQRNFASLCAGETYERDHLVFTILDIIRRDTGLALNTVRTLLYDFDGTIHRF